MSQNFEELFGPIVGRGAQATVYAKGEYAVKLYREGYPKQNVFNEAVIMANLERDHFPSPRIYEVLLTEGRYGLRMDRLKGKPVSDALSNPAKCNEVLDELVSLQCRLQKYDKVLWATDLKLRFGADIYFNANLSDDRKKNLFQKLEKLPDGQALCHCDFHPDNVYFDGETYTIIDLLQVSRGDLAADAACSYVAYNLLYPMHAEYYLNRYCETSGIPKQRVLQWVPLYAATILGQVTERMAPIVERFAAMDEEP